MSERIVIWTPAYDRRNPDPAKNYGVHGMELRFVLKEPGVGATQFVIFTNWMLPHLRYGPRRIEGFLTEPTPDDVGYHALVAQYEGQETMAEACEYLDGKPCYYDGSSLTANDLFDRFVTEGEEAVWQSLQERLGKLKRP